MTKAVRETRPVATGRIVHGDVDKDGKRTGPEKVFEAGDVVEGLDRKTLDTLVKSGAVKTGE